MKTPSTLDIACDFRERCGIVSKFGKLNRVGPSARQADWANHPRMGSEDVYCNFERPDLCVFEASKVPAQQVGSWPRSGIYLTGFFCLQNKGCHS